MGPNPTNQEPVDNNIGSSDESGVEAKSMTSSGEVEVSIVDVADEGKVSVEVSDFVVAEYDAECYIGQILEVDDNDNSLFINFMTNSGKAVQRFKWPTQIDRIWVVSERFCSRLMLQNHLAKVAGYLWCLMKFSDLWKPKMSS